MVKNRGIDVSIISQFDIQRVPEFDYHYSTKSVESNIVSRYVPIYPGSQIWFEYLVDPPHPPQAAYFFKLLINRQIITSWDCTEKHGYYGKMIYALEGTQWPQQYPRTSVQRQGFKFCDFEDLDHLHDDSEDCIEIRVHRIEHRSRIRDELPIIDSSLKEACDGKLRMINGGILEPGLPQRRYKYQLLDPVDKPYAAFRFFYRSYEYLRQHSVIPATTSDSPSASSRIEHAATSLSSKDIVYKDINSTDQPGRSKIVRSSKSLSPRRRHLSSSVELHRLSSTITRGFSNNVYLPLSDAEESLSVVARDTIEDLSTSVVPAIESPRFQIKSNNNDSRRSKSPTNHLSSPRQKLNNRLTPEPVGVMSQGGRVNRPLSPFTSSGLLRCMVYDGSACSLDALDAQFRPQLVVENERNSGIKAVDADGHGSRTSSRNSQREIGGRSLVRLLSRRKKR